MNVILRAALLRGRPRSATPRITDLRLRRLQIEIDPHRDVVRRLLPGADVLVDADAGQPVGGLRRQQQMVDADAVVLLPGAGLIVPEGVVLRLVA